MNHIVFGGTGLLGSALVRSVDNAIYVNSKSFDATNQISTKQWFLENRDLVENSHTYICSGVVAGIVGQRNAKMFRDNALIAINLLDCLSKWQKQGTTVYYSSSCIYPRDMNLFEEEDLLKGVFEPSNEGYALGKASGQKYCEYLNEVHGHRKFLTIVPPNLYGPNDNWDLATSHVLPALTQKIYQAKVDGVEQLELMGSPTIRREFIRSDDIANATHYVLANDNTTEVINIGQGTDVSLQEIVNELSKRIGYTGSIVFNDKMGGKKQKLMSVKKQEALGWTPQYNYNDMFDFMVEELHKRNGKEES